MLTRAGKQMIVLGKALSEGECRSILASIQWKDDVVVCDLSEYYYSNRSFAEKNGHLLKMIDVAEVFHKNEDQLRPKYLDLIAEWPEKKFPNGKNFKENFVWRGISLWWFSEPARKAVAEYSEFSQLCEVFTIIELVARTETVQLRLVGFPKYYIKILGGRVKRCASEKNRKMGSPLRWGLLRFHALAKALLLKILFSKFNSNISAGKKYQLVSWFPLNWSSKTGVLVDRMYENLVDRSRSDSAWCLIFSGNVLDLIVSNKMRARLSDLKQYYGHNSLSMVEAYASFRDIMLEFVNVAPILSYLRLMRKSTTTHKMAIDCVDVSPIFRSTLLRSFIYSIYEAQIQSSAFRGYAKNHDNTYISYGEFFPIGRAMLHGVREGNPSARIVWHQHAMLSLGKLIFVNRKNEVADGETSDHINKFPIADRYLIWGKQAERQLVPFFPKHRLSRIGSYKYINWENARNYAQKMSDRSRILIVPSNTRAESLFLFSIVNSAVDAQNDSCEIFAARHPVLNEAQFVKDLREFTDGRGKYDNRDIIRAVADADVVIVGVSTVAIDAMLIGKKVIICRMPNDIYYGLDPEMGARLIERVDELRGCLFGNQMNNDGNKMPDNVKYMLEYVDTRIEERFWTEIEKVGKND